MLFLFDCFIKKFVKKDNLNTLLKVDAKSAQLKKAEDELKQCKEEMIKERKQWRKEKNILIKEIKLLKEEVVVVAGNSHELVSNGTAHKVSEELEKFEEKNPINIEEEGSNE